MKLKCPVCKEDNSLHLRKMSRAALFGLLMGDKHVFLCRNCEVYRSFSVDVIVKDEVLAR